MIDALVLATFLLQPPACATLDECRRLTRDAIASGDYERAHDLAWLAYQRGHGRDPDALTLLARAQSLSGRGDDAFVMLRRLAERGVAVPDVESSDDFARVRSHDAWPQLRAMFAELTPTGETVAAAAPAPREAPPPAAKPPAAAPPAERPAASTPVDVPSPAAVARVGEDLALPAIALRPAAIVYDAVSARFILSSAATDALTVLSQTSSNAAALTSRGWSGLDHTTALAIDRAAGDLWVAVNGPAGSALHRLQLISGRRLDAVAVPDDPPARLVALTLAPDGLYALDAEGRRLLRRTPAAQALTPYVTLPPEITPTGLAASRTAIYVAHADGLLRVDLGTRRQQSVTAPATITLAGLRSLAWHNGALLAIQLRNGSAALVRVAMNRAGTAVTSLTTIGPAASEIATFAAGVYYYVATDDEGRRVLRAIETK